MATPAEYAAVTNALVRLIKDDIAKEVPSMFQGMIPADMALKLSSECAKVAVDTLDSIRKTGG